MKLKAAGAPNNLIETVYGIGYRLKPQEEKEETKEQGNKEIRQQKDEEKITNSQITKAQTLVAIAGVWEKYKGRVEQQVNVLRKAATALQNEEFLSSELHSQAAAEAHTLAGSLGTFGFANGSKLARQIEHLLKAEKLLNQTEIAHFNDWVKALLIEIDSPSHAPVTSSKNRDERPLLLIVNANQKIPEDLLQKSDDWLQIAIADSVTTARQKLYQEHPDVAIVDGDVLQDDTGLSLLAEFKNRKPSIPVIVLTEQTDGNNRLQTIRDNGNTILHKPVSPAEILETAAQLIKKSEDAQTTVLAVDDDPKVLEVLQNLLKYWGITVKTLAEPQKFWETLENTKPDLLILDVEMPGVSGIELCHSVRDSTVWSELPVLFLTVHSEAEIVNQVFSAGADDFVSKPIVGPELVTRIVNRLERIKLIRRMTKAQEKQNNIEAAERWRTIFNTFGECIKLVAADGTLLEMNPAGLAMIEADATAIGKSVYSIIAPEYRQAFEDLNQSVCQGNKESLEFEIISLKGNRRFVETHAVPLHNHQTDKVMQLAVTRDITARKQAEVEKQHTEAILRKSKEELENRVVERTSELVQINERLQLELEERQQAQSKLRDSQAQFAGFVEIADDAFVSIDSDRHITLFNQGAEKVFGYSASEAVGQTLDLLIPKHLVEAHRHHVDDFDKSPHKSRKMAERREIYGRRKDGSEFPAEASISKLKLGEKTFYTVYLQDVSHRRQIERMKNEFVSVVSHELRTPLTSIHGSLGMLATDLIEASSEDGKRLLQIATDSTERLVRMINDILDIERIESGKVRMCLSICQLGDLLAQAVDIIQPLADKAQVKISIENSPIQIKADSDRIIQTLTNLLSNAIRFSSLGETVWLTACEQDSQVLFAVKDTGSGIPEDKLESIFERFQQVDSSDSRNHEGTGLGLAICRSIIELHGGKIWVESVVGVGSTFYFTLPLLQETANTSC